MRLEKIVIDKIKEAIYESFGHVNIYLFGSRTDNTKTGGDIDLAVDAHLSRTEFHKNKIKFITNLVKKDFDLKIDLVNYNTSDLLLKNQIEKNSIQI
jgi:predicted nucleotidyltransferase